MAVSVVNTTLEKGTSFSATFNVSTPDSEAANFSDYSGVCKIRKYPTSPTYQNCSVSIVRLTGEITVSMAKTTTLLLQSGRNYYDVILTSSFDDTSVKVIEGSIIVSDSASI